MVPVQYQAFLTAATQASAALIGLLFVSVSIAPERVFGPQAEGGRQTQALAAFTALANIFFVSFGALIPDVPYGAIVLFAAALATSQTLSLLRLVPRWRREGTLVRGSTVFALSIVLYVAEVLIGVHLWLAPADTSVIGQLLEILLGLFAVGLVRAWELLGGPSNRGIASLAITAIRDRLESDASRHEQSGATIAPDPPSGSDSRR